jgi:hypothetical protein
MAFSSELHLDQLEEAISAFRQALLQPRLLPIRIVATDDTTGMSIMEILHD